MILISPRRVGFAALAAFTFVGLSGCAVPLAPGYKIEKQSITVRFVPGSPPHLAIRAEYRLANTGNAPLDFIDVGLPGHKSFGRENLRVRMEGKNVTPAIVRGEEADEGESSSSDQWPVAWRIPFSPAWPRKQKRNLSIEYDLTAAIEPRLRMYVSSGMFYLNDSGWFPDPLAPKSLLAKDLFRPDPSDFNVIVPENFLITGSGESRGARKSSAETEYRFRLRKGDFDPFVLAGQYHEQRVTTADGNVVSWTFKPMPLADAQYNGAQIASAARFYSQTFGPLPRSMKAIYDVELPDDSLRDQDQASEADLPFLPGVVYGWTVEPGKSFWTKVGNAVGASFGHIELAYTWFEHVTRPEPGASILAVAMTGYASHLSDESNENAPDRASDISSDLQDYDDDLKGVAEKPISMLNSNSSKKDLQVDADKLQLFLFALEDKCGRNNLNHALAHMVSALRFQQYGYDDFRSAAEEECHQDLGPFFRTWLNEKGIPADFRAKYEPASQKKN